MGKKSISPTVQFTDGVNQAIQVDTDIFIEIFDGDRVTPTFIFSRTSVPPIIENPIGGNKYSYTLPNIDVSNFSSTPVVHWFAKKGGSAIAEFPVAQKPFINESNINDLIVVSTIPSDQDIEVDPRTEIVFKFDQDIDPTSVEPGTFIVFEAVSNKIVTGTLRLLNLNEIHFIPSAELRESVAYIISAVGKKVDAAAGFIKSVGGGILNKSFTIGFRTGQDRFAKLEEVADRDSIERVAPIRLPPVEPAIKSVFGIVGTTPDFKATNVDHKTPIRIKFSNPLATVDPALVTIEHIPVLGLEEYFGIEENNRFRLWNDIQNKVLPTFTLSIDNDTLVITPQPSWLLNAELVITLKAGIVDSSGNIISSDFQFTFTTTYFPRWSSPIIIKLELNQFSGIAKFDDDTFNRYIHKASIELATLRKAIININRPSVTAKLLAKNMIVRDLIEMEIIPGISQRKQLGSFVVERGIDDNLTIQGKLTTVRQEIKKFEQLLLGPIKRPMAASKSADSPFDKHFRMRTWKLAFAGRPTEYIGGNTLQERLGHHHHNGLLPHDSLHNIGIFDHTGLVNETKHPL